jgi:SET domain-containing protein
VGEIITWKEAQRRHPTTRAIPTTPSTSTSTRTGSSTPCTAATPRAGSTTPANPNCEADEEDGRVFIKALRNIKAGEELNYDYGLIIDEPYTKKLKAEYPCWCGAKSCRGTLLAPKRRR